MAESLQPTKESCTDKLFAESSVEQLEYLAAQVEGNTENVEVTIKLPMKADVADNLEANCPGAEMSARAKVTDEKFKLMAGNIPTREQIEATTEQIKATTEQIETTAEKLKALLTEILTERDVIIDILKELKTQVEVSYNKSRKAKIAGSSTAITGTLIAVIGLGLSPVTLGASLGLTVTGGIIAGAGGITNGGAAIGYAVKSRKILNIANKACKEDQERLKKAVEVAKQLDSLLAEEKKGSLVKREAGFGVLKAGVGGVKIAFQGGRGLKAMIDLVRGVAPVAGRAAGIAGVALGVVFLPIDIVEIARAAKDIHTYKKNGVCNCNTSKAIQKLIDDLQDNKTEILKVL